MPDKRNLLEQIDITHEANRLMGRSLGQEEIAGSRFTGLVYRALRAFHHGRLDDKAIDDLDLGNE